MTNRRYFSRLTLPLLLTCVVAAGCSTNGSAAPFHMYSSPLLEGEMDSPRMETNGSRPGVEPRTVYVYRRWHPESSPRSTPSATQYASNGGHSAPLDTVQPSSQPVLANYDVSSAGSAPVPAVDGSTRPGPAPEAVVTDGEPSTLSAQYMYTVLHVNGVEFDDEALTSVPAMYRECRSQGEIFQSSQPNIGDLVFFHNTYDANDDGRNNDWYTQVGIIQDIATDGTVEFLAHFEGKVQTLRMNMERIDRTEDATGRTINSKLRHQSSDDPPYTQYLAGQLFAGYCNILGDRRQLILVDEWAP